MKKGYWVTAYRSISDPRALSAYAALAGPAIEAGGGRFIARGMPAQAFEAGRHERVVIVEFASVAQALVTFESEAYRKALAALGNAAERDIRIVEGLA